MYLSHLHMSWKSLENGCGNSDDVVGCRLISGKLESEGAVYKVDEADEALGSSVG